MAHNENRPSRTRPLREAVERARGAFEGATNPTEKSAARERLVVALADFYDVLGLRRD